MKIDQRQQALETLEAKLTESGIELAQLITDGLYNTSEFLEKATRLSVMATVVTVMRTGKQATQLDMILTGQELIAAIRRQRSGHSVYIPGLNGDQTEVVRRPQPEPVRHETMAEKGVVNSPEKSPFTELPYGHPQREVEIIDTSEYGLRT